MKKFCEKKYVLFDFDGVPAEYGNHVSQLVYPCLFVSVPLQTLLMPATLWAQHHWVTAVDVPWFHTYE